MGEKWASCYCCGSCYFPESWKFWRSTTGGHHTSESDSRVVEWWSDYCGAEHHNLWHWLSDWGFWSTPKQLHSPTWMASQMPYWSVYHWSSGQFQCRPIWLLPVDVSSISSFIHYLMDQFKHEKEGSKGNQCIRDTQIFQNPHNSDSLWVRFETWSVGQ